MTRRETITLTSEPQQPSLTAQELACVQQIRRQVRHQAATPPPTAPRRRRIALPAAIFATLTALAGLAFAIFFGGRW